MQSNLNDSQIYEFLQQYATNYQIFIAVDAPLTYNEGGGYREVDRAVREHLNAHGFSKIGVMAPTMTKMAYLTLRGLRIRELCGLLPNVQLFETHPGASLVLDSISYEMVTQIKSMPQARLAVWEALTGRYRFLNGLKSTKIANNDHELMAIAAMLSAFRFAHHQTLFEFDSTIIGQPKFIL